MSVVEICTDLCMTPTTVILKRDVFDQYTGMKYTKGTVITVTAYIADWLKAQGACGEPPLEHLRAKFALSGEAK
jgi:hypothetical protein